MYKVVLFFALIILVGCGAEAQSEKGSTLQSNASSAVTSKKTYPTPTTVQKEWPYNIVLQDKDQNEVLSSDVLGKNGKPTVLMFWLTTCVPCKIEMDAVRKVYPQWEEEADFNFYAVSTDFTKRFPDFVKQVETKNYPWISLHDKNRDFRDVLPGGLNGLPQTFVFDKDGKITYHKKGYRTGYENDLWDAIQHAVNL